jgi:hypothetical protein
MHPHVSGKVGTLVGNDISMPTVRTPLDPIDANSNEGRIQCSYQQKKIANLVSPKLRYLNILAVLLYSILERKHRSYINVH